ncbi:MAG: ABC transporter ATP-binding protein [Clostridiales bacterium]|nr:ABC transporter ATP-binding protein [Clostridiales bacterium]
MNKYVKSEIKKAIPQNNFKYFLYVFLGAVQAIFSVLFALAVKTLINTVEGGSSMPTIYAVIYLAVIVIISYVLGVIVRLLGDNLMVNSERMLKKYVLFGILGSDYKTLSSLTSGDLVSRLDGDVLKVSSIRVNLLPNILATAVRLIGTMVALFVLQPLFTTIILGCALVIVACSFWVRKVVYKLHKNSRIASSKQSSFVSEISDNAIAVKTFNAENFVLDRADGNFLGYKKASLKEKYFGSFVNSVINLCFTAFYTATAIYGTYGILNGVVGINFGVITAMLQLVLQIRAPISSVSGFFTAHAEMLVAGGRLFEIKNKEQDKKELLDFDSINLNSVSFSYGDGEVIKDASLTVNKGDKLLIKGSSGEGKTTLVKVIAGLYPVTNGQITINYGDNHYLPTSVSKLYSFVPQGNMIFSGTIKENVVFNGEYDEDRLNYSLKIAKLDEVINSLPEKENTYLSETFRLSEGQEQRLAIARAVYSKAPVIILDEPTSALDETTEKEVVKSLCDLDRTLIIISHKPAFENSVTKTAVISGGKLI